MLATLETITIQETKKDPRQIENSIITILTNWLIINEDSDTAEQETKDLLKPLWRYQEPIERTMEVLNREPITYDKIKSCDIINLKIK